MRVLAKILFPLGYAWSVIIYAILGGLVAYLVARDDLSAGDIMAGVLLGVFAGTIGGAILEELVHQEQRREHRNEY